MAYYLISVKPHTVREPWLLPLQVIEPVFSDLGKPKLLADLEKTQVNYRRVYFALAFFGIEYWDVKGKHVPLVTQ